MLIISNGEQTINQNVDHHFKTHPKLVVYIFWLGQGIHLQLNTSILFPVGSALAGATAKTTRRPLVSRGDAPGRRGRK